MIKDNFFELKKLDSKGPTSAKQEERIRKGPHLDISQRNFRTLRTEKILEGKINETDIRLLISSKWRLEYNQTISSEL